MVKKVNPKSQLPSTPCDIRQLIEWMSQSLAPDFVVLRVKGYNNVMSKI